MDIYVYKYYCELFEIEKFFSGYDFTYVLLLIIHPEFDGFAEIWGHTGRPLLSLMDT